MSENKKDMQLPVDLADLTLKAHKEEKKKNKKKKVTVSFFCLVLEVFYILHVLFRRSLQNVLLCLDDQH